VLPIARGAVGEFFLFRQKSNPPIRRAPLITFRRAGLPNVLNSYPPLSRVLDTFPKADVVDLSLEGLNISRHGIPAKRHNRQSDLKGEES
jgi:hypothetical protein